MSKYPTFVPPVPMNVGNPGGPLPDYMTDGRFAGKVNAYKFCSSCGVRTDYQNPQCLYPERHSR